MSFLLAADGAKNRLFPGCKSWLLAWRLPLKRSAVPIFQSGGKLKIKEDSMINKVVVLLVLTSAGCLFVPAAHAQATANTDSKSVSEQDDALRVTLYDVLPYCPR